MTRSAAGPERKKDYTRACIMKSSAITRGLNCLQQLEKKKRAANEVVMFTRWAKNSRNMTTHSRFSESFLKKKKEILNSRDMKRMSNKNSPPTTMHTTVVYTHIEIEVVYSKRDTVESREVKEIASYSYSRFSSSSFLFLNVCSS
jgi:hypothetical protein